MSHRIVIETVSDDKMRYSTLGDWFFNDDGDLIIQVKGLDPLQDDESFLIALHELVEAKLCLNNGIGQEEVDEFDLGFTGEDEPGDAKNSPYHCEHRRAMIVEHLVANFLGLNNYGRIE